MDDARFQAIQSLVSSDVNERGRRDGRGTVKGLWSAVLLLAATIVQETVRTSERLVINVGKRLTNSTGNQQLSPT